MKRSGFAPMSVLLPNVQINPSNVWVLSENDVQTNCTVKRICIIKPEETTAYVIDNLDQQSPNFYGKIIVLANPDGRGNVTWSPRDKTVGVMNPLKAAKLLDPVPPDGKGPVNDPTVRGAIDKIQSNGNIVAVEVFLVAKEFLTRYPRAPGPEGR